MEAKFGAGRHSKSQNELKDMRPDESTLSKNLEKSDIKLPRLPTFKSKHWPEQHLHALGAADNEQRKVIVEKPCPNSIRVFRSSIYTTSFLVSSMNKQIRIYVQCKNLAPERSQPPMTKCVVSLRESELMRHGLDSWIQLAETEMTRGSSPTYSALLFNWHGRHDNEIRFDILALDESSSRSARSSAEHRRPSRALSRARLRSTEDPTVPLGCFICKATDVMQLERSATISGSLSADLHPTAAADAPHVAGSIQPSPKAARIVIALEPLAPTSATEMLASLVSEYQRDLRAASSHAPALPAATLAEQPPAARAPPAQSLANLLSAAAAAALRPTVPRRFAALPAVHAGPELPQPAPPEPLELIWPWRSVFSTEWARAHKGLGVVVEADSGGRRSVATCNLLSAGDPTCAVRGADPLPPGRPTYVEFVLTRPGAAPGTALDGGYAVGSSAARRAGP